MPKKWLAALISLLILLGASAVALAAEAVDITQQCSFKVSYTAKKYTQMTDGKYTTKWESKKDDNPFVEITAPAGTPIYGMYICFATMPKEYQIQVDRGNGWETVAEGDTSMYHVYVPLEGETKVRLHCPKQAKFVLGINEIFLLSKGEVPDWVQRWEPTHEKADIMFLVAHPDDELIFMGGAIPTYAAEQQRKVVVAYLTYSNTTRRSELLNGLWHMGVRNYPVIGTLGDAFSKDAKKAYKKAGGQVKVLTPVVELFRKYKPEVVVTQDINGEYGHGQHCMVADAALQAYDIAATEGEYLDSFFAYDVWQVKKLYLHLWEENQLRFDWSVPLESMNGKTGLQLADEAYTLYHITQRGSGYNVAETGAQYDNTLFGLARTTVGQDMRKDDFLENIYEPASYVPVPTTPAPTPAPTPVPAYVSQLPALNEKGFLDEGEYVYSSEEEGLWIFINQTAKIVIQRRVDTTQPLVWFEAEMWGDVEAGELLRTVQYDEVKMGKARADASETAKKHQIVFAMNTDYYTYRIGGPRVVGVTVRDGKILYDDRYTEEKANNSYLFPNLDCLAFFPDGSLNVYRNYEYSAQEYIDMGAYDVYSFGPYLMKDGRLSQKAYTSNDSKNPRCAIGMIEPGHYVAILCEGRLKDSTGVTIGHLSQLMREAGCEVAFNLDGGQTGVMVFMGKQLNRIGKYDGKTSARPTSEVMAFGRSEQVGEYEVK